MIWWLLAVPWAALIGAGFVYALVKIVEAEDAALERRRRERDFMADAVSYEMMKED